MVFYGRNRELEVLTSLQRKKVASLVVIKGRRRIGKSTLVERFASGEKFYKFSGLAPSAGIGAAEQREFFVNQFKSYFGFSVPTEDWWELLLALASQINHGRVTILLDEISWMASGDSTFLPKLKEAWDTHFKKNSGLMLVLCGSVSSWIEENIISNTGFVGRVSSQITLQELPLSICEKFFGKRKLSLYDKSKFLSVTGGVPKYLEEYNSSLSIDENIKHLCFSPNGFLFNEFEQIFSDAVLSDANVYRKIVEALVQGPLDRNAIIEKTGASLSGKMSGYLEVLSLAGFVRRDFAWNLKTNDTSKLSLYRLSDNYLRFYLKYIVPNKEKIRSGLFDGALISSLPGWYTIMGLQVENLVLNNRVKLLGLVGVDLNDVVNSGPYFQRKTNRQAGCQVDYLIQTKINSVFVCETKFSKKPLGMSVLKIMQDKLDRLSVPKGFTKIPVLVHVNGVADSVIESDYFYRIISLESFFVGDL